MRKLFALLILATAVIVAPSVASAMSVSDFEPKLQLLPRYYDGTLSQDVKRVQGKANLDILLVGATPEQKARLQSAFWEKYDRNMASIHEYITCLEQPLNCGNQSARNNQ